MPSKQTGYSVPGRVALLCAIAAIGLAIANEPRLDAQQIVTFKRGSEQGAVNDLVRRFYPDDPIWRDGDMRDTPPVAEFDLSKTYEFLHETFGETVQSRGPALNVNTLGEVPESSWF